MKRILIGFLICCYISSCYTPRYVYSPVTQDVPSIDKKNDLEVSANYGTSVDIFRSRGNYNRGLDLHGAWAISKHFAIMLNENFRWESNSTNDTYFQGDSSLLTYKRNFTEIGFGYFTPMKKNEKMQFQVFAGAAFGSSKIFDDFFSNSILAKKYHESRVTKIYVQPSFIYKSTANFNAALSSRFTEILFSHIHTNYTAVEQNDYLLDSLRVSPVFFWEPALTYTFGFKKLPFKFRLQGSVSVLLNHRFVEHRSSNISIGIVSNFKQRRQKKKSDSKN
ncbi:MAG: hypothetical protein ABI691_14695 [Ginsengibacter sp.]